jgi:hypothetical protein
MTPPSNWRIPASAGSSYSEGGNKGLRVPTRDSDRPGRCLSLLVLARLGQRLRELREGAWVLPVKVFDRPGSRLSLYGDPGRLLSLADLPSTPRLG